MTAPASAATQQRIEVSWTVQNSGTGNAQPSWSDNLYLSTDASWDASDIYLGISQPHGTGLAAGASYTVTVVVTIPNVPAGSYYLLLRTDRNGNVYESNEANNDRVTAIAITTPDLTPTALTAPTTAVTQQQVEVSWTVQNSGTGNAQPSWSDNLYLSTDASWDASDIYLGISQPHGTGLAAGASYTVTVVVTIPNVPAGSYYLLLRTDRNGNVYESNEANNDRVTAIAITTPDLTPTALAAPTSAAAQQLIQVSWTVQNSGTGNAQPSWSDNLYLSTDASWDASDIYLGISQPHGTGLAAGASYTVTVVVTIPNVPAGSYYLLLRTDRNGNVYESNEANNDRVTAIAITGAGLTPTNVTATAGDGWVTIAWDPVAGVSSYNIYRATTPGVTKTNGAKIAGVTSPYPDVGLTNGASFYYVVTAVKDGVEGGESRQVSAMPNSGGVTTPDLTPTALTAPASAATQQQIEVSWTVQNQGTGDALPSWSDNLYLSTNDVWDTSDTYLAGISHSVTLAASSSYVNTLDVRAPNVPAGSYYLVVRIDRNGNVYESNEANNDRATAIAIATPDLTPTALTAPASAATQQQIEVSWTVQNQGTGDALPSWSDNLYLSTNDVWDTSDTYLAGISHSVTLAASSSYVNTLDVRAPNVPAGSYYLVVRIDRNGNVYESNEANNDRATAIAIATPDLTPTALTAPASAATQQQIEVSWTVVNQGTGDALPSWSDNLYLSTNNVWDVSDTHLAGASRPVAAAAGSSYVTTLAVTIPNVPAGSYYLVVRTDRNGNVYESNEANNDRATAIAIATPDLTPTALTAPASASTQQQIEVSWTVVNQGTGDAQPSWSDNLYFSANNVWDPQDSQIGYFQKSGGLSTGASYTASLRVQLPQSQPGTRYLILLTDGQNSVYESNEANNETQKVLAIQVVNYTDTPWRTLDSGQGGGLGSLDFSPDGLRLVASEGSRAFIWDIDTGSRRVTFAEHAAQIDTVDFSPTGDQVLSGAHDGTSRIWDTATHQQVRSFSAAGGQPNPAVMSGDGTRVLAGSGLNLPRLWEAVSGAELRTFPGHTGPVNAVALSPDGSKALTGSADRNAVIWDAGAGSDLLTLSRHTDAINAVAFSPDGASALTASSDGSIRLWDVATGTQTAVFIQPTAVASAAFSPDGRYVVSAGGWPGVAYLWEISSGALAKTFSDGVTAVNGVAMSPDRTLIATTHSDGQMRLWQSGLEAVPLHPITLLPVGSEAPVTLRSHGLYYFEVNAEAGRNLVITLEPGSSAAPTKLSSTSATGSKVRLANLAGSSPVASSMSLLSTAAVSMLAKEGGAPSPWQYEFSATATLSNLHAEIPIAGAEASRYYVLVFAPFLSEGTIDASIRADYKDFHLSSVSPDTGGNAGNVTTLIRGTGFTSDTVALLVGPGTTTVVGKTPAVISPTEMSVTFDLAGAVAQEYALRIEKPGSQPAILERAFGVTAGGQPQIWATVTGPDQNRPDRWSTYTVSFGNSGLVDAYDMLLVVTASPGDAEVSDSIPRPAIQGVDWTAFNIGTRTPAGVQYPIWVYRLSAQSIHQFRISLRPPTAATSAHVAVDLYRFPPTEFSRTGDPAFLDQSAALDALAEMLGGIITDYLSGPQGSSHVSKASYDQDLQEIYDLRHSIVRADAELVWAGLGVEYIPGWGLAVAGVTFFVLSGVLAVSAPIALPIALGVGTLWSFGQFLLTANRIASAEHDTAIVRPIDPNDKVGPAGAGETRLVSAQETLQYTVNFENMAAATAPVQEMAVVDYLDTNLDWTTLQFADIVYGSRLVTVPDGVPGYATRDLPEPPDVIGATQGQLAVDVTVSFDAQNGRIEWRLRAIDTATGLPPEDPLAGFLPPEDGTGSGQGHVSFSIKPKADAPAGHSYR